jgi:hypothetical protein
VAQADLWGRRRGKNKREGKRKKKMRGKKTHS